MTFKNPISFAVAWKLKYTSDILFNLRKDWTRKNIFSDRVESYFEELFLAIENAVSIMWLLNSGRC